MACYGNDRFSVREINEEMRDILAFMFRRAGNIRLDKFVEKYVELGALIDYLRDVPCRRELFSPEETIEWEEDDLSESQDKEHDILIPAEETHPVFDSYGCFEEKYQKTLPRNNTKRLSFTEVENPVALSWKNIQVYAPLNGQNCYNGCLDDHLEGQYKAVINNVSGIVHPGTLLAIMGASGAGKSTLLNVLTQRNIDNLVVSGEVLVNGQEIGRHISNISAYVQQEDLFVGTLTVEEQLWFQSMLKMDKTIPKEVRKERVNGLIQEMGLEKCRDVRIGLPGVVKGISGGQKKRLALACEVLTNPPLLFCDEPTSGLDSFMSRNVVEVLKEMAHKGRTVVCTIHQPSSEVFALFDRVLLMVEGNVAFLGSSEDALTFFEKDCGLPCPAHYNPADHYILSLAVIPREEKESMKRIKAIRKAFDRSSYAEKVKEYLSSDEYNYKSDTMDLSPNAAFFDRKQARYKSSWCRQFTTVLWRSWMTGIREPAVFRSRVLQVFTLGFVTGCLFYKQTYDQSAITNLNGAMYTMLIQISFGFAFSVVKTFPAEFPIFIKEHHDGMYRVDVYFLAKILSEFPQFMLIPFISCTIIYWMTGMYPSPDAYITSCLVIFLVCNVAVSVGYLLSSCHRDVAALLSIAPVILVPLQMIGGLYIDIRTIPSYALWLKYISWFTYSYELLLVNQWTRVGNISCSTRVPHTHFPTRYNLSSLRAEEPSCLRSGLEVLGHLGHDPTKGKMIMNFLLLVLMIFVWLTLAFLILYIRSMKKTTFKKYLKRFTSRNNLNQ